MKERTKKDKAMDHPDDGFGLRYVKRVAVHLQPGTRVYVQGKCGPSIPYGLQFMVEEMDEEAVVIEYSGWIASYYRPQRVRVPLYHVPTRIPFDSAFNFKASERPPLAIALLDGEPVQLLVGAIGRETHAE